MGLDALPPAPASGVADPGSGASVLPGPGVAFEAPLPPPKIELAVEWEDLRRPVIYLDLSDGEEQQLVADVLAAIQATADAHRQRMETVQKVRDRFYLTTPNRTPPFPEGANWHVPFTRWVLDAVAARLWGNAFGATPWIMATGVQGRSDVDQAARTEPFLQFVNAEELHLDERGDEALERILTDGFVMAKVPWRRDVQRVTRRRVRQVQTVITDEGGLPMLDEQGRQTIRLTTVYDAEEAEEEVYHGPDLELVTIDNFIAPNPNEADVRKQPWVAQQFWMTKDQLWRERERTVVLDGQEQTVGLWRHVDQLVMLQRREDASLQGLEAAAAASEGVSQEVTSPDLVGEIRCYEVLWPYRAWAMVRQPNVRPDDLPDRVILTIAADDGKLIRAIHYPFWDPHPESYWVKLEVIHKQGRWFSQSLGEILMPVQDELDTIHWQRTDATTIMLLAFLTFLAEEGSADSLERIKLGQRNVVESIDGIKLLADVIKVSLQAPGLDIEQLVLKFGELLSAIAEPQLGSPSRGDKTAFEIGTIVREGNLKFTKMLARFARGLVTIDRIVMRRYAQYYPLVAPKLYRVRSDDDQDAVRELALGDLQVQYDLQLRGQTVSANKEIEAAKAFRVLTLSEQSLWLRLILLANPQGVYELVKTFLHQIDWPGGTEVLIGPKDKAVAAITQALQALAGAQRMAPANDSTQGNGDIGANLAALRPIAQLLNDSGLARELAATGVQATGAGVTETGT